MSRSMTRIRRTGAVLLLVAVSFSGGVAHGVGEPPASPGAGRWPTASELRASLGTLGYAFSPGASGSPWTGDGFWTGGQPDIPGSFAWTPERSVRLDGAHDVPVTARLLVGADARLIELLDLGTAVGVPTSLLLEVGDAVRKAADPALVRTCAFSTWPVPGGRIVLWRGGMREATDLEVAFEPQQGDDPVEPGPGPSSGLAEGIPASAEEACGAAGDGATGLPPPAQGPAPNETATITVVTIQATEFGFSPVALTIPSSGATRIVIEDVGHIVHNLTVDALDIQVVVPPGGSGEVMIVDPSPGTYPFYCSISGHKEAGMVGTITVE